MAALTTPNRAALAGDVPERPCCAAASPGEVRVAIHAGHAAPNSDPNSTTIPVMATLAALGKPLSAKNGNNDAAKGRTTCASTSAPTNDSNASSADSNRITPANVPRPAPSDFSNVN